MAEICPKCNGVCHNRMLDQNGTTAVCDNGCGHIFEYIQK